ncbi:MAG: SDR family oxidoreductase [Pseudomonadales bacterium]|nr:SDR family oxidoreductase [Pseudomonadales bacterium]
MSQTKTALIVGASRGIGLGLVKAFQANGWSVIATVRTENPDGPQSISGVEVHSLDVTDRPAVKSFAEQMQKRKLDLLFVSAGISGPQHQSAINADDQEILTLFQTNAIAPLSIAQQLDGNLNEGGVVAFMSSIMGSVAGNESGGTDLYRASKAALNSMIRSYAARLTNRNVSVLALHPGWVKTAMGGDQAPVSVAESAEGLVAQIEQQLGKNGQRFIDFQGATIPW